VGDRANDSVRVDALQLRSKVVGEGANLGFTQQARIEYALGGGVAGQQRDPAATFLELADLLVAQDWDVLP